jgi:putative membrane protein insertion efficiency factor
MLPAGPATPWRAGIALLRRQSRQPDPLRVYRGPEGGNGGGAPASQAPGAGDHSPVAETTAVAGQGHRDPFEAGSGEERISGSATGVAETVEQSDAPTARGIGARALLLLIRGYQWIISPLLPSACRFTPSCSEYARLAVIRYGAWRGGWKAVYRVLRCNPFNPGGVDYP